MNDSICLSTGLLGLFLALPTIFLHRKRPANLWLGLFVLSLASLALSDFCMASGLYRLHPRLIGVFDWPVVCLGPLYYCYVRQMTGLGNSRRQLPHFVPLALFLGYLIWLQLNAPSTAVQNVAAVSAKGHFLILWCVALMPVGYVIATLFHLKRYRQRLRTLYSATDDRDLTWLSWSTAAIVLLLALWMPAITWGGIWGLGFGLGRIIFLCILGWYGLHQADVFAPPDHQAPAHEEAESVVPESDRRVSTARYARSGMSVAASELIGRRLDSRMHSHRDYLENDLKLIELAERVGSSPHLVSQYLNDVLGLNFYDYINGLRIAHVQRMLLDESNADRTLLDLAFGAGFNSKSTFNGAFKKINGSTPSEWRKQQLQSFEPIG